MRTNLFHKLAGVVIALPLIAPISDATAQAPTYTGNLLNQINYYLYLPNDDHLKWMNESRRAWNRYLIEEGDWIFSYYLDADDNPIRDRLPKPQNGANELGVLTSAQMATQGFPTWESLGANGINIQRVGVQNGETNVILENDTLINPAIANDAHRFRKTLTHQFGRALGLGETTHYYGIMYPETDQQPPNSSSLSTSYTRAHDLWQARNLLAHVNANLSEPVWPLANFNDMAVWSQTHSNPGSEGSLLMTDVAPRSVAPGQELTISHIHVENRGNQGNLTVALGAYLSTDKIISSLSDRALGSIVWDRGSFPGHSALSNFSMKVRIPAGTPPGTYYVGLSLTQNIGTVEKSQFNNSALLRGDQTTGFEPILITVTN